MYDVFLSYCSSDKQHVETLAARLKDEAGLNPFLDKWHLVPGEPWQERLEAALAESATCAVFFGASGLGPWQCEEVYVALNRRVRDNTFRVIPVLLPQSKLKDENTLPLFLQRLTWVDFHAGLDDHEAFYRLVAGIHGFSPGHQPPRVEKKRVKWVLVLSGIVEDVDKARAEAIAEHMRQLSGDFELTINKIEPGSIRLTVESSEEGFIRIESFLRKGDLHRILGLEILEVRRVEGDVLAGEPVRLFVGNLHLSVSAQQLENLFNQAGFVLSTTIVFDKKTGRSRGYAFVEMDSLESADAALEAFNGFELAGRRLIVVIKPPSPKDDRSNGGIGGPSDGRGSGDGFHLGR